MSSTESLSFTAALPHENVIRHARLGRQKKLKDSVELILKSKGSQVYSISADATVYEALERLAEKDVGALVVMNGTELAGVFSERDYCRKVILKGRSSKEMQVHDIMSSQVVT